MVEDDIYEIRVKGHRDGSWTEWLGDMVPVQSPDGTTSLTGPVCDQAALHGLLNRLFSMGLQLLSVRCLSPHGDQEAATGKSPKAHQP